MVKGTARQFVEAKLAERDERHKRMGDSRYVLEPNIKEGKGGLRDLHTLFWIAKYVHRVERIEELVAQGRVHARRRRRTSPRRRNSCGPCAAICTTSPAAPRTA